MYENEKSICTINGWFSGKNLIKPSLLVLQIPGAGALGKELGIILIDTNFY